jgi:hypothetical protein
MANETYLDDMQELVPHEENVILSEQYFKLKTEGKRNNVGVYYHKARVIREAKENIPDLYRKHRNLNRLNEPGIGPKLMKDLENILEVWERD